MLRLPAIIISLTSLPEIFLWTMKSIKLKKQLKILNLNLYKDRHIQISYTKVYLNLLLMMASSRSM